MKKLITLLSIFIISMTIPFPETVYVYHCPRMYPTTKVRRRK